MIDVWQKMYKICPDPQLDFVSMNQVGRTGYFLAATALPSYTVPHTPMGSLHFLCTIKHGST